MVVGPLGVRKAHVLIYFHRSNISSQESVISSKAFRCIEQSLVQEEEINVSIAYQTRWFFCRGAGCIPISADDLDVALERLLTLPDNTEECPGLGI